MDAKTSPPPVTDDSVPAQTFQPPRVRLRAAGVPMVPMMANHVVLDATPNTAYLNFGFVEPQAAAKAMAPGVAAREIDGVLVSRMAIPVDALALLHHQITVYLQSLQSQVGDVLAALAKNAKEQQASGNSAG
jgi:hypothetical protein